MKPHRQKLFGLRVAWRAGLLMVLSVGVLLSGGCGKTSPAQSTVEPMNELAAGKNPRAVPVTLSNSADASAQLAQLNQLLRRFCMERQRVPQSLSDLVKAGYLASLPATPAGQQFVFDAKHVQVSLEKM